MNGVIEKVKGMWPVFGEKEELGWAVMPDQNIYYRHKKVPLAHKIEPGFYQFGNANEIGLYLQRKKLALDNLLRLPDTAIEKVLAEAEAFWKLKPAFQKRGLVHKRGVLLYGPPGSGKTAGLMIMAADLIESGGLVIQIHHAHLASNGLQMVRQIEPHRRIVCLLEDFDELVEDDESGYLSLLDGENQVDNVMFVATTNYPENLDKRFTDRPSRFDTVQLVGMPSARAREAYLAAKEPDLSGAVLAEWVAKSEGYSIAHLRELIVLVFCFGKSLDEAIERLNFMRAHHPHSAEGKVEPTEAGRTETDGPTFEVLLAAQGGDVATLPKNGGGGSLLPALLAKAGGGGGGGPAPRAWAPGEQAAGIGVSNG